jgi:hypothetical protein
VRRVERESAVAGILGLGSSIAIAVLGLRGGPAVEWLRFQVELWLPLVMMIAIGTAAWIWTVVSRERLDDRSDGAVGPELLPTAGFESPRHDDRVPWVIPHAQGWVGELPFDRRICLMVKPHGSNLYWLQCGGALARQPNGSWHGHDVYPGARDTRTGSGFDLALVLVSPKALAVVERHHKAQRGVALPPGAAIIANICVFRS